MFFLLFSGTFHDNKTLILCVEENLWSNLGLKVTELNHRQPWKISGASCDVLEVFVLQGCYTFVVVCQCCVSTWQYHLQGCGSPRNM